MKNVIRLTVLALTVAAAAPASAQDAKAAEVLAASRKAIGDKKLDALKTFSAQATLQRNVGNMQAQSEVEMLIEMPDKYVRSDVSSGMMNMTMTTGFNGGRAILPAGARALPGGGMVISMGGGGMAPVHHEAEKPTPEQVEEMNQSTLRAQRQEISRMMLGWFSATHPTLVAQYSYAGEAESPDGKAHVIDVKDADGFSARLFIDQNSKLPLMVTYKGRQRQIVTGGPGTTRVAGAAEKQVADLKTAAAQAPMTDYTLFFEDWREVDGINFPHVVRRASDGATNEEWTFKTIKVNPRIDAKKFAVETKWGRQ